MVAFRADAEHGDGVELAEEMKVKGYPTFVVTDSEGRTIKRWAGYDTPASFAGRLADALDDPTTIDEKKARFQDDPTLADAVALGEYSDSIGAFTDAAAYYERALEYPDADPNLAFDVFLVYAWGHDDGALTADELRRAADQALEKDDLEPGQTLTIARVMARASRDDDSWSPEPYIRRALEATEGDPELADERRLVLIEEALHVTGDTERALELKRETLPEGWQDSSEELNGFAWWCFENRANLEEAEKLALRGAGLAEDDRSKAMILDTAAEIAFVRGDAANAVSLTKNAIEMDPDNNYYAEQLARFEAPPSDPS